MLVNSKRFDTYAGLHVVYFRFVVQKRYSCLREIGSNGEIGIRSIDANINPIVSMTKTIGLMLPEIYCIKCEFPAQVGFIQL